MIKLLSKEEELFVKQILQLCERCKKNYSPCFTSFLDGRAQRIAAEYLRFNEPDVLAVPFGGFENAERVQLGLFPKDVYSYEGLEISELYEVFEISALKVQGSGFSKFSHRDVMGSVLALGIKRETMGDIFVADDEMSAYLVMTKVAAEYVKDSLDTVGRDKIKVGAVELETLPKIEKRFVVISGTVASERLDCVVSLALNVSREKAKQIITSGLVSVNHAEETRVDYALSETDILSVRGSGRFIIHEFGSVTRKGRNRTVIHKMI